MTLNESQSEKKLSPNRVWHSRAAAQLEQPEVRNVVVTKFDNPEVLPNIQPNQSIEELQSGTEDIISGPGHSYDSLDVTSNQSFNNISVSSKQTRDTIKQGEEEMAEVDTAVLSTEHGAIRHDVAHAASNIRSDIGSAACGLEKAIGDNRWTIATEAASLSKQIGAESCGINKHIGDMRQEDAENFGHARRDIQGTAADIRREQAVGFGDVRYNIAERAGDIRREVAQGFDKTGDTIMQEGQEGIMATKDARYDLASRITNGTDRVSDRVMELRGLVGERFYTVGRDLADLRQGQATLSKDIELNSLKGIIEGQKNTQYLSDRIASDGEKTRALINDHKYHDLNRALVERQTELVNCEQDRHRYHDNWWDSRFGQYSSQNAAQLAAMQNQLQSMNQNFNSQLSETRQGMVNFGTMAGVGQTSSANNVR